MTLDLLDDLLCVLLWEELDERDRARCFRDDFAFFRDFILLELPELTETERDLRKIVPHISTHIYIQWNLSSRIVPHISTHIYIQWNLSSRIVPHISTHIYIQWNLSSRDTVMRGHFLKTVSYVPDVKEAATKGQLSCKDRYWGVIWRRVLLYLRMWLSQTLTFLNIEKLCLQSYI